MLSHLPYPVNSRVNFLFSILCSSAISASLCTHWERFFSIQQSHSQNEIEKTKQKEQECQRVLSVCKSQAMERNVSPKQAQVKLYKIVVKLFIYYITCLLILFSVFQTNKPYSPFQFSVFYTLQWTAFLMVRLLLQ